jgi:hypothetical protein
MWERNGRVILKKPGADDYGLELGAPPAAERFQVRLVGSVTPGTPRSAARDADQEVMWCGDFDRLRELLGKNGNELLIEKAMEAGVLPLRSVGLPQSKSREVSGMATPTTAKHFNVTIKITSDGGLPQPLRALRAGSEPATGAWISVKKSGYRRDQSYNWRSRSNTAD